MTNQSNNIQTAASYCLTLGAASGARGRTRLPGQAGLQEQLDVSRHMHRLDHVQCQAALLAPAEEVVGDARIGTTGVRVADVRGEEVDVALGGAFALLRDQQRYYPRRRAGREAAGRGRSAWSCRSPKELDAGGRGGLAQFPVQRGQR